MAAPFPPQGNQKQQTERPIKVYAEQYLVGQPLPIGAVVDPVPAEGLPALFTDGLPRVATPAWVLLNVGDWVISNRYTGKPIEVISAEEFAERFGPSELAGG